MPFIYKSLASGLLPSSKGTLFTATEPTCVKKIVYLCIDPAAHIVNLYVNRIADGVSIHLIPVGFAMDPTDATKATKLEEYNVEMTVGDAIEGDCDSATAVQYYLTGAEQ